MPPCLQSHIHVHTSNKWRSIFHSEFHSSSRGHETRFCNTPGHGNSPWQLLSAWKHSDHYFFTGIQAFFYANTQQQKMKNQKRQNKIYIHTKAGWSLRSTREQRATTSAAWRRESSKSALNPCLRKKVRKKQKLFHEITMCAHVEYVSKWQIYTQGRTS